LEGKAPLLSCQQVIVNLRRQLENTQSDFDNEALYNTNEHTQQRQEILKLALEIGKLNSTIAELKRQNQIFIDTMGILVQRK
jgi:adenosyl cobinamide kinase/adenosyl cobinamide phosphate guanylyltransferase